MKYLFIILFLFGSAKAQYLIVSSEAKAKAISKTFYQLSRPIKGEDVTEYLFDWKVNDSTGQAAVLIDTFVVIPKGNITVAQVDNWMTEIYGSSLTNSQKNSIRNYFANRLSIPVRDILVAGKLTLVDEQYLINNGWIKN